MAIDIFTNRQPRLKNFALTASDWAAIKQLRDILVVRGRLDTHRIFC